MQRKRKGFSFLRLLFLLVFFLSIHLSGYFYTYNSFAQESNLKQNQDPGNKELDNLEEKIFHQNYSTESKEARVSRLESFLFGKSSIKEDLESRIKKITASLKAPEAELPVIKPESLDKIPPPQEAINNNEGIIGAINQIEMKMFNMTFNEYPFQARINALEDRLLSKQEIIKSRTKPLLERMTTLVNKSGLPIESGPVRAGLKPAPTDPTQNQKIEAPRSYSINPNTGLLINDQTGEVVKDNNGQPISVMLPPPIPLQVLPQQNYGYQPPQNNPLYQNNPYGNQFPQNQGGIPSPYDFLFNQQNNLNSGGSDPDY